MPKREEVYAKVAESLADALGVEQDEISEGSRLTTDLGAESIDFLDIVFRLEKAFNIKVPRGDLFPENLLNNAEYVKAGRMTEAGLSKLREKMPHADLAKFEKDPRVGQIADLFTVGMIVNYVINKLNAGQSQG
ncbi:MAG: acyl carrier protein [Planctomycetota bacterium]